MTANQVKHDAAIDVAGRFARGHLKIGQVNLSHLNSSAFYHLAPTSEETIIRPPNYITNPDACQEPSGTRATTKPGGSGILSSHHSSSQNPQGRSA
jgi:hypothetical protein